MNFREKLRERLRLMTIKRRLKAAFKRKPAKDKSKC